MPIPPLSAAERRLGTFALLSAAVYAAAAVFFAAFPLLTLKISSQGGPITLGPGARLWHALAIAMMAMLAFCCLLAARAPRENRKLLLPVLLSKATSVGMAILTLAWWQSLTAEELSGRRTLITVILTDLPLFLATSWFYWKAAPGVHLGTQATQAPPDDAPKPITLGIAKPAAPPPTAAAAGAKQNQ
jgi:hypothetical protein